MLEVFLYLSLIPVTVGGLALFLKARQSWLKIIGFILLGVGLFFFLLFPALWIRPHLTLTR